jgi:short-subunit dehydrogenase
MQKILIVGATSAIAEACARRWAARGDTLFLVARDAARLDAIRADLSVRRPGSVAGTGTLDIDDIGAQAAVVEAAWRALDGIDVALLAPGTLPDQTACEHDVARALREFDTNGRSAIALLAVLAQRLQPRRGATIAAISSVAGDRGRASNYLYGSAKAALSTFLGGLRQRLHGDGVNVLTIKPGFVDTPMTRDFRKGPLWASADAVAAGIVRAVDRRKAVAYLPAFWWPVMAIIRHVPEFVFRRMKL